MSVEEALVEMIRGGVIVDQGGSYCRWNKDFCWFEYCDYGCWYRLNGFKLLKGSRKK